MSWIEETDQPDLPDIFRVISINAQALDIVRQLNQGLAFGNSTLSRVQEEAIATVVSVANRCRYGALTHGGFLRRHSGDSEMVSQVLNDYTTAILTVKDRLMLDFAVRITLNPTGLTKNDVERLRAEGFEDQDIVSVVLVTCLINFMNRVACSLGVEAPNSFHRTVEGWLTGPARQKNWLFQSGILDPQPQASPSPAISGGTKQSSVAVDGFKMWAGDESSPDNGRVPTMEPQEEVSGDSETSPSLPEQNRSIQQFVDECCVISPEEASTARDLYIGYIRWCDEKHRSPLLQRNFGVKLSGLGFHRRRRGHGRHWWLGIGLRTQRSTG